jgi:mannose-1-phosphate guanylyltransferase
MVEGVTMRAMVLAAGLGTRLLPLTKDMAKPAVPFANRPLIHYCLEWLCKNDVDEVVINLHHHPESVISVIEEHSWAVKIHFSHEPQILGTAGGLKKAETYFVDGTFIMVNSDSVYEIDLAGPLAHHREKGAVATMVLREASAKDRYGRVIIDKAGRVKEIRGRETLREETEGYMFTGIHVFEPGVFHYIPAGRFYEINQMVYPRLIQEGRVVQGFVSDIFWAEVGNHKTYLQAHRDVLRRRRSSLVSESRMPPEAEMSLPVLIGRDCHVGAGARIGPMAVVGHRCTIGKETVIEDSVLWNDVTVGAGSRISGSIVGHGTSIAPGTHVEGMVACLRDRQRIE